MRGEKMKTSWMGDSAGRADKDELSERWSANRRQGLARRAIVRGEEEGRARRAVAGERGKEEMAERFSVTRTSSASGPAGREGGSEVKVTVPPLRDPVGGPAR